ncbi:hypothetical protein niasHS_010745 [Heterodera schachtii]|uniref:Uncharacterized protein n=1 Tax=Heterodera schachtii TaxID=97005 RepID=A0ABD2J359_HETSC
MTSKMVAVITATAVLFARNGYHLSLCGRNEKALEGVASNCLAEGGLTREQVLTIIGDVCEEKTLQNIVKRTDESFGRIDVLVNCAGVIASGGAENTPTSVLDGLMNVNVKSMIRLSQLVVPYLEKTKGSIVNVSSIAGICAFPAVTYYCISKAAVDKFTECLSMELAPKGIRVNAVNPALIVTELHLRSGMPEEQYTDFVRRGAQTHALGRVGTPEEVASSILFLARDATFTTGQLLKIDGGKALMTPR